MVMVIMVMVVTMVVVTVVVMVMMAVAVAVAVLRCMGYLGCADPGSSSSARTHFRRHCT